MKATALMTLSALLCTLATCCTISRPEDNRIRIGHTLNKAEKEHVSRRRTTVQQCLEKHNITWTLDKVPNIALIGSGGGERAMVGLLGSLLQLKKEGLLDCMMYLSGVSGSTWCMSSLYKEENWSTDLKNVTDAIVRRLSGESVSWKARGEKLKKYYSETDNYSLTHFWSAVAVPIWVKEIDETRLSAQRGKHPKDPYPIFTVIDKGMKQQKPQTKTLLKDTWVEMTIPEAGYTLAGAFVDQKSFGSKFDDGNFIKDQKEMDMLYIQGLCGSALADGTELLKELWKILKEAIKNIPHHTEEYSCQACEVLQDLVEINLQDSEDEDYSDLVPKLNKLLEGKLDKMGQAVSLDTMQMEKTAAVEELKRLTLLVCDCFSDWYKDQEFIAVSDIFEYLKIFISTAACIKSWKWGTTYNFLYNMQVESMDPGLLATKTRDYIDAGLKLNSPYFSVLRPEREIDLIISLDFSAGDPMLTVSDAHKMAKELGIAFPPVRYPEDATKRPKAFYEFQPKKQEDTKTPTVIHMPLFNIDNSGGDLEKLRAKYKTLQGAYSPEMITELMGKAAVNVRNNADMLWAAIRAIG